MNAKITVDPKLLEILVCPVTKQPLRYEEKEQELVSEAAASLIQSVTAYRLCWPMKPGH